MKFNLQGFHNDNDIVDPSIKIVSVLGHVEISKLFHCHGLVLCVTKDHPGLLMWNPYLGQTRLIQPMNSFSKDDKYAFGYDNNKGYHKILRGTYGRKVGYLWSEIYDCNSDSWRVLDVNSDWAMISYLSIVSLKGNTYFLAQAKNGSLHCFDFTAERFGPLLPLPFQAYVSGSGSVALSCVTDEQLGFLYRPNDETIVIQITTKIGPDSVSWSKFLEVGTKPLPCQSWTFFTDEAEKKVLIVSSFRNSRKTCCYQTAYIIGEDGYFKSVDTGETRISEKVMYYNPVVFSSYVPSLVQLK
ncbi:unnamed protein product [Microthlaspi erraticum]|uniref:F-box associated beta-propeller type 1 domain-containing protein n=1 Tax=Microthlaspi erraticum TaxID=1685480 RepID=A0A6D2JPE9_9BRAS|nr:unnamed protein product [Microthlaspi erraticum]